MHRVSVRGIGELFRLWLRQTLASVASLLLVFACLAGCGGDGHLDVYPVSGTVNYKGKPIEGAKVLFFGQEDRLRAAGVPIPEGTTDASGQFQVKTYKDGDGAPAGKYGVAITWMEVTKPSDDPEEMLQADRLNGKYANVDSSGLTAEVKEDDNQLPPFELK